MLFNSLDFLLFFPIVFVLYWFVFNKSIRHQNILILFASYFFYGWWSWKFLILLLINTLLDYYYGIKVAQADRKKAKSFLWLSIINNLGILAVFKYYNFFALEFAKATESIGFQVNPGLLNVAIPIGISFYTFHGMSYIFDIYARKQKPVSSLVDYAVFVSFFPLLVAGPIERANHFLPQIQKPRKFDYIQAVEGLRLILWGMFKKIVVADNLAPKVNFIFSNYNELDGGTLWLGAIYFAFQIYCDFSGYSDIAIGTSKLLGFELLSNFKYPYFSRNIGEFWKRWHISLSSWFRDYLYIPLGGSKNGILKAIRNVFIIFLVSGFWHGANWTYVCWGLIHALLYIPSFIFKSQNKLSNVVAENSFFPSVKEFFQMAVTFFFVTISWVFFRSETILDAAKYTKKLFFDIHFPITHRLELLFIIPLILIDWQFRHDERRIFQFNSTFSRYLSYLCISFAIIVFFFKEETPTFIYFQF